MNIRYATFSGYIPSIFIELLAFDIIISYFYLLIQVKNLVGDKENNKGLSGR
jgi:hypothetical protein